MLIHFQKHQRRKMFNDPQKDPDSDFDTDSSGKLRPNRIAGIKINLIHATKIAGDNNLTNDDRYRALHILITGLKNILEGSYFSHHYVNEKIKETFKLAEILLCVFEAIVENQDELEIFLKSEYLRGDPDSITLFSRLTQDLNAFLSADMPNMTVSISAYKLIKRLVVIKKALIALSKKTEEPDIMLLGNALARVIRFIRILKAQKPHYTALGYYIVTELNYYLEIFKKSYSAQNASIQPLIDIVFETLAEYREQLKKS